MNTATRRLNAAVLIIGIIFGLVLGSTQRVEAQKLPVPTNTTPYYPYYNNYYNNFIDWQSAYNTYHVTCYYYYYLMYLYYYYAGLFGDYVGYYYDPLCYKSDKHLDNKYYSSFTYHDYYYNLYAYYGDWYCHQCESNQ